LELFGSRVARAPVSIGSALHRETGVAGKCHAWPDSAVTPRGALQITSRDKEHVAKPSRAARRFRIMSALLVPDDLWEAVEPRLPKEPAKPKDGRARIPDRAAFVVIDFVLGTGCPWRSLPKELGCGSGVTCWRRLRDWQEAGVWQRLPERLLNWLGDEAAINWSRASVDSLSVRAKRGAPLGGRSSAVSRGCAASAVSAFAANGAPT
jgi:transposase